MTPAEIIYHRRVACLADAKQRERGGDVPDLRRVANDGSTSGATSLRRYGLEALMPKDRRVPQMPNATPTWVVNELLTMAVTEPTIGCRQYADRSRRPRVTAIGKSTVQDILVRHGLGRRHQRVARAAAIAALTSGMVTEAGR